MSAQQENQIAQSMNLYHTSMTEQHLKQVLNQELTESEQHLLAATKRSTLRWPEHLNMTNQHHLLFSGACLVVMSFHSQTHQPVNLNHVQQVHSAFNSTFGQPDKLQHHNDTRPLNSVDYYNPVRNLVGTNWYSSETATARQPLDGAKLHHSGATPTHTLDLQPTRTSQTERL